MFKIFSPFPLTRVAFRIKFDETLQMMNDMATAGDDDVDVGLGKILASQICFVVKACVCSTTLPRGGYHWACPPQYLRRGKAECMWEALQRSLPSIRPFAASNAQDVFPKRSQARWCWYLFNADSAKSCKRLVAFAESKILAEDDGALCAAVWCNIHLVHLPLKSVFRVS